MTHILVANIIALIASILMAYSGLIKQKKKILYVQTIQCGLSIASNIILGGITGAIINTLSCIRNILCYKDKLGIIAKLIISAIAIYLSLKYNNLGIIGLLPLISTITYLWLMNIKKVISFKLLIMFTMVLWFAYDFSIKSYTAALFDFITFITNLVSIFQIIRKRKRMKKYKRCSM